VAKVLFPPLEYNERNANELRRGMNGFRIVKKRKWMRD
jgi:hypothetical protein